MNFMKNLKIGKKLIVTFGVIIILFLISLMVSIVSLNNSGKNFKEFYTAVSYTHLAVYKRKQYGSGVESNSHRPG